LISDQPSPVPFRTMVGIPAHNEEGMILQTLGVLTGSLPSEIESIYIVSCSADSTDEIVVSYGKIDSRVKLCAEGNRKGKATAMNRILELGENYDAIVSLGGDNIPETHAVRNLVEVLKEEGVGIVGARPVPLNSRDDFLGYCAHMMMNLHHLVSLDNPKISGELFAFKTKIVSEIPSRIVNDDVCLQFLFGAKGLKARYVPNSIVYLMCPTSLRDFIEQRRRTFVGHFQAERLYGKKVPTNRLGVLKLIRKAAPRTGVKGLVFSVGFLFIMGIARAAAHWDALNHNFPYRWKTVITTKRLV
jgi:biofilm PGA synthesis N-glycosyltransferase PgaC